MMKSVVIFSMLLISQTLYAETSDLKVVYGSDDRQLVSKMTSKTKLVSKVSQSVFAQINKSQVKLDSQGDYLVDTKSVADKYLLCKNQAFAGSKTISNCTAFLVAPNILATAGHCVGAASACRDNVWAADYIDNEQITTNGQTKFNKNLIYTCKRIIAYQDNAKSDFALIEIDRSITNREPLVLNRELNLKKSDRLTIVGHPLGMPQTLVSNIKIDEIYNENSVYIKSDTFSGNSGSPVVNERTGLVEGVFTRGDMDFNVLTDQDINGCRKIIKCNSRTCPLGEKFQRANAIPRF